MIWKRHTAILPYGPVPQRYFATAEVLVSRMDMQGQVALVAGASRGIGAAAAEAFATAGAAVVLAARDLPALQSVAHRIEAIRVGSVP